MMYYCFTDPVWTCGRASPICAMFSRMSTSITSNSIDKRKRVGKPNIMIVNIRYTLFVGKSNSTTSEWDEQKGTVRIL